MGKIINIENLNELNNEKKHGDLIILAGGCFDILHKGHIEFLRKAKALGGTLVVMLEGDEKVRELKGEARPLNKLNYRAQALLALSDVNFVIPMPYLKNNSDYEILVKKIEPDIIAVTAGESIHNWEKDYMNGKGGRIVEVIKRLPDYSTSKLAQKKKL